MIIVSSDRKPQKGVLSQNWGKKQGARSAREIFECFSCERSEHAIKVCKKRFKKWALWRKTLMGMRPLDESAPSARLFEFESRGLGKVMLLGDKQLRS